MGSSPLDLIAVDDVGEAVRSIFLMRENTLHKTVSLTGAKLSVREIAAILTHHVRPKQFKDKQVGHVTGRGAQTE